MFLRRLKDDEQGAALAAVIAFMTVAMLLVTLICTSVVSSLGRSTSVRAGVQAQAAAEAGIAAARVAVDSNNCTPTIDNSTSVTLRYKVMVYSRSSASGTWANQCPVFRKGQVKYTATGYATASGVNAQRSGDVAYVEAMYSSPAVPSTITGTGAAIYSYGTGTPGGTGYDGLIGSIGGAGASVQVYQGKASCTGLSVLSVISLTSITADVLLRNGNYDMRGCTINGNLSVGGNVTMSGGLLDSSRVSGKVTATNLTMSGISTVNGGATLASAASRSGLGTTLTGTVTVVTTPPVPAVPPWTDFDYQGPSGWPGFTVRTLAASECNSGGISLSLKGLIESAPVLIDAQACTAGISGIGIALAHDVALILPNNAAMSLGGIAATVGLGGKLWIVQPDADTNDNKPTCPAGGSLSTGAINLALIPTMIYTPCTYTEGGIVGLTVGQIYAGKASFSSSVLQARQYQAIGLPGVDLTTSTSTATGPRSLLSFRNVQSGP